MLTNMTSIEDGSAKRSGGWGPRMTALSATLSRLSRSASPPVSLIQRVNSGEIMSRKASQEDPSPEQMPASRDARSRPTIQARFSRTTSSELDGRTVEDGSVWDDAAVSSDASPATPAPASQNAPLVGERAPPPCAAASLPPPSHLATLAPAAPAYILPRRTSLMDSAPFTKKGALSTSPPSRTMPIACRSVSDEPSSMLLAFESVEDWGKCTPYDDTPPQVDVRLPGKGNGARLVHQTPYRDTPPDLTIASSPEAVRYGAGFSKFSHL